MFKNWGFLLGEIWILILLAALLGLFAGWLIWGRRSLVQQQTQPSVDMADYQSLQTKLADCHAYCQGQQAEIARLNEENTAQQEALAAAAREPVIQESPPTTQGETTHDQTPDYDGDGLLEGKEEGVKPTTLDAPRDGQADDLKMIKGVGAKMEQLCNSLGFYHFDQIANWTADEVAWVDANLEGFKGRVSRDGWVEQAKLLAQGEETEFSKRVKEGGVY